MVIDGTPRLPKEESEETQHFLTQRASYNIFALYTKYSSLSFSVLRWQRILIAISYEQRRPRPQSFKFVSLHSVYTRRPARRKPPAVWDDKNPGAFSVQCSIPRRPYITMAEVRFTDNHSINGMHIPFTFKTGLDLTQN